MKSRALILVCAVVGCTPPPPSAGFELEPTAGVAPLQVRFRDRSQGEATAWRWDFGDGSGSDLREPLHVYLQAGSYDVSLRVTGPGGEALATRRQAVRVEGSVEPHNLLLVVLDDVSVSDLECYGVNPDLRPGLTPTIDALAERGVLFETAWTNPLCSPTRAAILTGRQAFRTGIGSLIETADVPLSPDEVTLNEALVRYVDGAYATGAFGKWHLEPLQTDTICAPTDLHGFDVFDGNLWQGTDYCDWPHIACPGPPELYGPDGVWHTDDLRSTCDRIHEYMPAYVVDRARDWIAAQDGPWFCYLAPQTPYHLLIVPPGDLQHVDSREPCFTCPPKERICYDAAMQAFDTKLAQLLQSLGPDWEESTTVVVIGDNGTPNNVLQYWPKGHGKGSLYEGGVHVPLIVAGRGVAPERRGTRVAELVSSTDLYRTLATIAGARALPDDVAQDSIDFGPLLRSAGGAGRAFLFTESFRPNATAGPYQRHTAAVRDQRYKLIYDVLAESPKQLFDLAQDPLEQHDLLTPGPPEPGTPAAEALAWLVRATRDTLGMP